MRNLITAEEVIELAFAENSNMRADSISDTSIRIAEIKYIRPAFGAMYTLLGDKYADFTNEYVKPALAYFVKCEIIASIAIDMSNSGVAVANPQYQTAASDKQRQRLYDSEMNKAKTLLDFALEYIATNNEDFPDFSGNAPKKHHRVGGLLLGGGTSPKTSQSIAGDAFKNDIKRLDARIDGLEGASALVETTYLELRDKRDAGQLTPGAYYRITDYKTITSQKNTQSAEHPFDVVVLALDEQTLSEDAYAIQREGDEYFANARLNAWRLRYTIDNDTSRFAWAKVEVPERSAKWSCVWGVLEEKNSSDASTNYTTAVVDGRTKYLYAPTERGAYLDNQTFYRNILVGSITSTNSFIYEADYAPYDEGDDYWYWDEVSEIRVKTADGKLVTTLYHNYDNTFYDENDEMQEYYIQFSPDYTEVDGVYRFTPESGVEDWWEYVYGGSINTYEKEYYTGSKSALYYAFDTILPKSNKAVTEVYSTETKQVYMAEGSLDTVVYQSYIARVEGSKGVIYRMIDEHNNDCPYDFKNIQFQRSTTWYYTFSYKGEDFSLSDYCSGNYLAPIQKVGVANETIIIAMPSVVFNLTDNPSTNKFVTGIVDNVFRVPIESGYIEAYRISSNEWIPSLGGSAGKVSIFDCYVSRQIYGNRFFGCRNNIRLGKSSAPLTNFYGNDLQLYLTYSGDLNIYCTTFSANVYRALLEGTGNRTISGGDIRSCVIEDMYESSNVQNITFDASLCIALSHIVLGEALTIQYGNTTSSSSPLQNLDIDARGWGGTTITIPSSFKAKAAYTMKVAKNSSGTIKYWCEADLVV